MVVLSCAVVVVAVNCDLVVVNCGVVAGGGGGVVLW